MMLLLLLLLQDDPIASIKTYRAEGGDHWLAPAAIAAEALEKGKWRTGHKSANEFLANAATCAGYQVNSFRRQVRTAGFLREQLGEAFGATLQSAKVAVSAVEMLARLHEVNPNKAKQLLRPVLDGDLGFVAIRKLYEQETQQGQPLRSALRASVKARSAEFKEIAKPQIVAQLSQLFTVDEVKTIELIDVQRPLPYARLEAVLTGRYPTGEPFAEAVVCRTVGVDNVRSTILSLLEHSSLLALQFRRVWTVFPMTALALETPKAAIDEFVRALGRLQMQNVGVLLVSDHPSASGMNEPRLMVRHRPLPSTDTSVRQQQLLAAMAMTHAA
jgi:hypothetical protein